MNNNTSKPMGVDFSKFDQVGISQILNTNNNDYRIDLSIFYDDVECLLNVNGVGVFAKGDIQAIKGKAKQGKSFFIVSVVTALLRGSFGAIKASRNNCKVLLIDTEQNRANVARNARKIHKLCGWSECENNPRLSVLTLRKEDIDSRKNIIEKEIASFLPDLVMLDGVKDICNDFLDNTESGNIVSALMRLSEEYKTAICCVQHENKKDTNGRGHLGAELVNKCSEEYQITKEFDTINVEQTECRNAPLKEKLSFTIDENGLPTEMISQEFVAPKEKVKFSIWPSLFADKQSYTLKELRVKVVEVCRVQDSSAYGKIRKAIKDGDLLKDEKDNVTLRT